LRFGSADSANLARQILVARLHEALRQSTAIATDTSSDLQLLEVLQSAKKNVNAVPAMATRWGSTQVLPSFGNSPLSPCSRRALLGCSHFLFPNLSLNNVAFDSLTWPRIDTHNWPHQH
jgi:hypothetical protein